MKKLMMSLCILSALFVVPVGVDTLSKEPPIAKHYPDPW